MKKSLILISLVLVMATVLSGCSDGTRSGKSANLSSDTQTETEPAYGGSLVYGMTQDLVSLDPHQTTDAGTRSVMFNIYEGLVKPDPEGDPEPAVAEGFHISDDASVYTFTLREGVVFHNGKTVAPEDVIYSIKRYAEVQGETSAFSMAVKSVEKTGEREVTLTLNQGDSEFISQMTLAIMPEDAENIEKQPCGTGPFRFRSYEAGNKLVLEANDAYWIEELPYLDQVTFRFLPDVTTAVTNLKAGTIDVLNYLTYAQVMELQQYDESMFRITEGNMNLVQAMFLNHEYGPLSDVKVRQALCYGVDREAINQFLFGGRSTVIGSHMIPAMKTWYEPAAESVYTYDVEKAKALLKEAGYENGFDLEIAVPSSYSQHVSTAEIIAEQLSRIGVRVTIDQVEWSTWIDVIYHQRQYQATVIGFDGKLNPSDWLTKYTSSASNNLTNYASDSFDALHKQALQTVDTKKKAEIYKQMQMELAEQAVCVYIQDPADFVVLNSEFDGYVFYPTAAFDVARIYRIQQLEK